MLAPGLSEGVFETGERGGSPEVRGRADALGVNEDMEEWWVCDDGSGRREGVLLRCCNALEDASSKVCSKGMLGACSSRTRDPPILGKEREKRSFPYACTPVEVWVRSLLMRPDSSIVRMGMWKGQRSYRDRWQSKQELRHHSV